MTQTTPEQRKAKRRAYQAAWQRGYAVRNQKPRQNYPRVTNMRTYTLDELAVRILNATGRSPKEDCRPELKKIIKQIQTNAFDDGVLHALREGLVPDA